MKKFKSNTKPTFKYYISLSIQAWQGKVRDRSGAPQHARRMHFRCVFITYVEHNYEELCSGFKRNLINYYWLITRKNICLIPLTFFYKHFSNK